CRDRGVAGEGAAGDVPRAPGGGRPDRRRRHPAPRGRGHPRGGRRRPLRRERPVGGRRRPARRRLRGRRCGMRMSYRSALHEAHREALRSDPRVFLVGEDVGRYGGAYAVSKSLLEEFGPERVMDAPLSESGFTGMGIGAAMGGLRPIVEIMTVNFSLLAMDQIVNGAAVMRYMSGGQFGVP